jgi:hypothetical protein
MATMHARSNCAAWSPLAALLVTLAAAAAPSPAADLRKGADRRLQQQVTARLVDFPLTTWLAQLSRETGISLRTAKDYEDRAITVRVTELPLGDLMEAVASLYGDVWIPAGKKSEPAYVLEASRSRRARQQRLLEAYEGAMRSELMGAVREVARNGPPKWLEIPAEGEDGYPAAEEFKARGEILSQLDEDAIRRLFAGERFRVRLADAAGKSGQALWSFAERFAMPDRSGWTAQVRANAWVEFCSDSYYLDFSSLRGLPLQDLKFIYGTPGGRSSSYNVVVHPGQLAPRLEQALAEARRGEEQDPEERRRKGGTALAKPVPATPALRDAVSRSEILAALADAADLDLVSDSHVKPVQDTTRPASGAGLVGWTAEEALSAAADLHTSYWRAGDSAVLVRSRFWWLDDLVDPPASALAQWRATLDREAILALDEAARIGALSRAQQQRLLLRLPEAGPACGNHWLRFYAGLTERQRRQALSPKGLELWKVPEPQRHLFSIRDSDNPYLGNKDLEELVHAAAVLKVTDEGKVTLRPGSKDERSFPRVYRFLIQPVPDAAGHTHAQAMSAIIPMPHRARDRTGAAP